MLLFVPVGFCCKIFHLSEDPVIHGYLVIFKESYTISDLLMVQTYDSNLNLFEVVVYYQICCSKCVSRVFV